jgi:hypothetical protein
VYLYSVNNFIENKSNIFVIEVTYMQNGALNLKYIESLKAVPLASMKKSVCSIDSWLSYYYLLYRSAFCSCRLMEAYKIVNGKLDLQRTLQASGKRYFDSL